MSDEKETNEKKGFFSRFMKGEGNECGCGCCGGIKIVPKESSTEKEDSVKEEES
ncbi:hypothetical protein [Methanoplanus limicola]|uniref:Uncharacterized protein n=1 Tax=Methanoplanus limicola DSM 2279 TaxID=937775 RepID=H1Z210_9EURY|nr:hypothetical protein [Methanoplanus limicola]EHQ36355.1 hypothetical protein Metlim_2299 [Methanoplanus limicola DSM 2279]